MSKAVVIDDPEPKLPTATYYRSGPPPERKSKWKPSGKTLRKKADHHEMILLPDPVQAAALEEFIYLAFDVLWPMGIAYKFEHDKLLHRPGDLLTETALCAMLPKWKQEIADLRKLPVSIGQKVLRDVMTRTINYRMGGCQDDKLLHPEDRKICFSYVRFRKIVPEKYSRIDWGDDDDEGVPKVNDTALHLPKLGHVEFTSADEKQLHFLRTANIYIKGARVWEDDGGWQIDISFDRRVGGLNRSKNPNHNPSDPRSKAWFPSFEERVQSIIDEMCRNGTPDKAAILKVLRAKQAMIHHTEITKYLRVASIDPLLRAARDVGRAFLDAENSRDGGQYRQYISSTSLIAALAERGVVVNAKQLASTLSGWGAPVDRSRYRACELATLQIPDEMVGQGDGEMEDAGG